MLISYVTRVRSQKSLIARVAYRMSSHAREKDQSNWINEHSIRILDDLRGKGDAEKHSSYEILIEGVHRRKELLLSYNIGVPVEEREKDMNKRAAKLVGLAMPDDPGKE